MAALLLAGCTGDPADTADGTSADAPGEVSEGDADDAADGPDVELPEGWSTAQVQDAQFGPARIPQPVDAVTWTVGDEDDLARLAARTSGTDWWAFWGPRLQPLEAGSSNVRTMVAGSLVPGTDPSVEPIAIQVTWSPYELEVDPDDAEEIAEVFATIATAQGSSVEDTRTVAADGLEVAEVAEVAFQLDPDVLDREVWQRFVPASEGQALWSVQCDGPSDTGQAASETSLEDACRAALAAFLPPA